MVKHLLFAGFLFLSLNIFSQTFLLSYPFTAVTASSGVNDPTPPPTATGLTCGAFSAVGVSTNPTAASRFSFDTWPNGATTGVDTYSTMTGALSVNKYFSVTLTPQSPYCINFTSMQFDVRRSGTGVRNWSVRTSANAYSSNVTASVAPTQTNVSVLAGNIFFWNFDATSTTVDQKGISVIFSGLSTVSAPLTIHFYAWNAEANTGTFSIDSVRINGNAFVCMGVAELGHDINAGFKLYPNPSNDGVVYVESKNANALKVEVLNMLGSVVSVQNIDSEKTKLDLNVLPAGTYFVRIIDGTKARTEKLFINK